ncbi:hypothetical protein GCM10027445_23300 [Amycolatopsis endophytica]|uniref:Uncharacterized protein n=1 Tax=Amycolatopsis endophytica TaxID=860233 RepID=A0A853BFS0_9PSEU|nr:hypothetical protein [Amycolatopsis endophytica]NYI93595.1 hypothetical protein [Amycolatopsis endophytica]
MSEIPELRKALRTRESLAPDPEVVLAGAHGRIRRRRTKRRVVGAAAAVAVTIAGVGAGMSLLRPSEDAPRIDAAAGDAPVAAPALPFTVDGLPEGYELTGWTVSDTNASGLYDSPRGDHVEIILSEGTLPEAPAKVPNGRDVGGYVSSPAGGGAQAQKQIAPGRIVTVLAKLNQLASSKLLDIAGTVRLVPTPVPSTLRALRAPEGLTVRQWTGSDGFDYLVLCPDEVPAAAPTGGDGRCYSVTVEGRPPSAYTTATSKAPPPVTMPVKSVRRLLDGGRTLTVRTESGTQPVMDAIASSAVAG